MGSYSFSNLQKNQTLSVTFVKKTFTITATSGPNGSITPGGTSTYSWGTSKAYYFYPSVGYHVGDVLIDGVSVGAVTGYNFTNIQANHTVSVSFVQ